MHKLIAAKLFSPAQLERNADWLAIAIAVVLPWSTSATGILVVLWLIAVIPTLKLADVRRAIRSPAGSLPVALFALGVLGMLWADATLSQQFQGLNSFFKLLTIPLLMAQFQRSSHGRTVFFTFLMSCVALLIASYLVYWWPHFRWKFSRDNGVLVKNYIVQSAEFMICALGLLYIFFNAARSRQFKLAALCGLVAIGFFADIFFIATSRTTLVVLPILILLLGATQFGWKGVIGAGATTVIVVAAAWMSSGYLRDRVNNVLREVNLYEAENIRTPTGERLEFWKKSIQFVTEAPIVGHGTGSIGTMFRRAAIGTSGASSEIAANPHNQTFAVGIQLGLVGVAALWAMWVVHLLLFRGAGLVSWIGLVVVVQNVVGSLFNSHLFDFTEGWIYVVGVGVTAGMVQRLSLLESTASDVTAFGQ